MKGNIKLYVLITLVALLMIAVLSYLSRSRFDDFQLRYPQPYNPYISTFQPFETFDQLDPFKDASAEVQIFEGESYTGAQLSFTSDQRQLSQKVNSFKLGPFSKITFYEKPNFGGISTTYTNAHDFVLEIPEFNNENTKFKGIIKSFKLQIIQPYAIAYTQTNLGGISKIFAGSVPVLSDTWKKHIQSLVLSPYTKITIFDTQAFKGKHQEFVNATQSISKIGFVGNDWKDNISSLKVESIMRL